MQDGEYTLGQLIDVARLQRTCDRLSAATGTVLAVLSPDGTVLVASGWQDLCTRFHRANETTAAGCLESDRRINERVLAGMEAPEHIAYQCVNGLWDVAFPLIVDGHHLANVFTGQFFYDDDDIDVETFRTRARELGFDEDAYMDALTRVPVLTHEQVDQTMGFLTDLVGMLSESGLHALHERESHAALAASEQRFRSLAEDMPGLVCITDADGRVAYMNAAAAAMAGTTGEETLGRNVATLMDSGTRRIVATARTQLTPEQPIEIHEERIQTGETPPRCIEWTNRGFFDDEGRLQRVQAMGRDVTDRRQAERRLEEARELLHYIIQHDQNAIAVLDTDLRYIFVSQRFLDDYGIGDMDVTGQSHYEVFPEIPERWREIHRRVLAGRVEQSEEDPFPREDGSVDWVRWECRPWYTGDGGVGGMVLYSEHITERREAAEALRRSREQYQTFIDATDDMAFLKDEESRYVLVNSANARFFERPADEIRGRTDDDLMPAAAAESCRASDLRALKAGGVVVTTEAVGDKVYESRKFPVELGDGRVGVGGYVRDVTEQRRADDEIRRLATDLERRVEQRTEQLEATNRELESFAYSISHDLRAPLRALDGFSEILLQDYGGVLDEQGRGYLRRIKSAANHMAGLMDGLLQLSRLNREELALEQIDLSRLARDVIDELRRQEPGRNVDVLIESGLLAQADPRLMRVALANLIGNAWKFTSRHEQARIEVGSAPVSGDHDGAAFYVKDDGAGFDPRYARNLFGAFQRLHTPDQFEGSGIGLATVQRIVHRHGGKAWADGEVERGATFWFTLAPDAGD